MKIVAFGNSRYKRIAHNWALYLQRHQIENYTIYSLDQDIYEYLIFNKINTELVDLGGNKWNWLERFKYIYSLLNTDIDILHSDLDAVWQANPLHFIERGYDIVASTGTHPFNVNKKIGYTLCMGWIYFKPSDIVKELFQNILDRQKKPQVQEFDDQRALNRELYLIDYTAKFRDLKVKTLDQTIISRVKPHNEDTYVAHPFSDKSIDREKLLKSKNLWILQ